MVSGRFKPMSDAEGFRWRLEHQKQDYEAGLAKIREQLAAKDSSLRALQKAAEDQLASVQSDHAREVCELKAQIADLEGRLSVRDRQLQELKGKD